MRARQLQGVHQRQRIARHQVHAELAGVTGALANATIVERDAAVIARELVDLRRPGSSGQSYALHEHHIGAASANLEAKLGSIHFQHRRGHYTRNATRPG